jgi:hypothetical protein
MSEADPPKRRRLIPLGELIALAALVVSALGVWIAWESSKNSGPTQVVEQRSRVPLALRGTVDERGRTLTISPTDSSHALESIIVKAAGAAPIEIGSDGKLEASQIETAIKGREGEAKGTTLRLPLKLDVRYVEDGADRRAGGNYVLRYKWEGGGLFGGRSLHLVGFSRA